MKISNDMKKNYAVVLYIIITILYLLYFIGERIYIYRYIHVTSILLPPTNKHYLSQLLLRLIGVPLFWCDRSLSCFTAPAQPPGREERGKIFPTFTRLMSCLMALTYTSRHTTHTHSPTFNLQLWGVHCVCTESEM